MFSDVLREVAGYMQAGGLMVMVPLLLATLVLWFAIGYRFAALKTGTKRDVRNLLRRYFNDKMPKTDGVIVRALGKGVWLLDGQMTICGHASTTPSGKRKRSWQVQPAIVTIVAAPLGLLGTVIGMIETFDRGRHRVLPVSGIAAASPPDHDADGPGGRHTRTDRERRVAPAAEGHRTATGPAEGHSLF
jgi:hypothetical protein